MAYSLWLALMLVGCDDPEKDNPFASQFPGATDPCIAPLMDLVKWRDLLGNDLIFDKQDLTPEQFAAAESKKVYETVDLLRPVVAKCKMTWSISMFKEVGSPADRLREETLLILLDLPAHAYEPDAIGLAGKPVR